MQSRYEDARCACREPEFVRLGRILRLTGSVSNDISWDMCICLREGRNGMGVESGEFVFLNGFCDVLAILLLLLVFSVNSIEYTKNVKRECSHLYEKKCYLLQ